MRRQDVRQVQRALNRFTEKYLDNMAEIRVDGAKGKATNRRIMTAKWYLGYEGNRTSKVTPTFMRRLEQPLNPRRSSGRQVKRGKQRRAHQHHAAAEALHPQTGVSTFDGRPVASWLREYLVWAREHGWQGTLNSGWRDPAYSESLCFRMCGRPSCPGRCAGRMSNHAGSRKPAGAVDVSFYTQFGQLMQRCPLSPRIFNALGAQDPVHFSASGR